MSTRNLRSLAVLVTSFALSSISTFGTATAAEHHVQKAATTHSVSLTTGNHMFITSTGAHVYASVSVSASSSDPTHAELQLGLSNGIQGGGGFSSARSATAPTSLESHYWSFVIPSSDFVMKANGNAMLTTHGVLGPYGFVTLWFTTHSHASFACASGPANQAYTGQVSAKFVLNSGAQNVPSSWGKVNQGTKSVAFGTNGESYLSSTYCSKSAPITPSCRTGVSWSAPTAGSGSGMATMSGGGTSSSSTPGLASLSVAQDQQFSFKVKGVTQTGDRFDSVTTTGPSETFTKTAGGGQVAIKTTTATAFSGTATISTPSAAPTPSDSACQAAHGAKKTEHQTFYFGGTGLQVINWANGASPYTASAHVGKLSYSIPNGPLTGGSISVFTFS